MQSKENLIASIQANRTLLTPEPKVSSIDEDFLIELPSSVTSVQLASVEARSEVLRLNQGAIVVVDETQARWIFGLNLVQFTARDHRGPFFVLHNYYAFRLRLAGLEREAQATESLNNDKLEKRMGAIAFEVTKEPEEVAEIMQFIRAHELGHVIYSTALTSNHPLVATARSCSAELTRLLAATLSGDRSSLGAEDLDPRYEDIADSIRDYLSRYVFSEPREAHSKYEADLKRDQRYVDLLHRDRRFEPFRLLFESTDFIQEAFCDLVALETLVANADAQDQIAGIISRCWRYLHAQFALAATDSLVRDREAAAAASEKIGELYRRSDVLDEAVGAFEEAENIRSYRRSDPGSVSHGIAMIRAIYRRVIFINYLQSRPNLLSKEALTSLEREGIEMEDHLFVPCATIHFSSIHLEESNPAGFGDMGFGLPPFARLEAWQFAKRIPGLASIAHRFANTYRRSCSFCGSVAETVEILVVNDAAGICSSCIRCCNTDAAAEPCVGVVSIGVTDPSSSNDGDATQACSFCEGTMPSFEAVNRSARICDRCIRKSESILRRNSPDRIEPLEREIAYARTRTPVGYDSSSFGTWAKRHLASLLHELDTLRQASSRGRIFWFDFAAPEA